MKKSNRWLACFLLIGMSSCSITEEAQEVSSPKTSTEKSFENQFLTVQDNVILQKPQVADLEVLKDRVKVSKTYKDVSVENAKSLVKGEFMKQQKCDVIVESLIFSTSTITDSASFVTATVSGYPAFYRNIRNYQIGDSVYFMRYKTVKL